MKKNKPKFYALVYDFNTSDVSKIDIMEYLLSIPTKQMVYYNFFDDDLPPVQMKYCTYDQAKNTIKRMLYAQYAFRYEYELDIVNHFGYSNQMEAIKNNLINGKSIDDSFYPIYNIGIGKRIDVYDQIEPNIDVITTLYLTYKGLSNVLKRQ